ncbi:MAG: deaminase [Usitatibacteraceae bacterium]
MSQTKPPNVLDPNDPLLAYWNKKVEDLASVALPAISPETAERHHIYSLLTMALVHGFWNGNKNGAVGEYPFRPSQLVDKNRYRGDQKGDRYLGHNIACIAVDEKGYVIDFEFNHNETFNSSAEHAEARLIRRVFSLNQIHNGWDVAAVADKKAAKYGNTFSAVTIYTSLESCAQCSGIMALASVLRVVYLQSDPGQFLIGNMLYNLTGRAARRYGAPEPLSADAFGFEHKQALDQAYAAYYKTLADDPEAYFFRQVGSSKKDSSKGITSFLCTDAALEIYATAAEQLARFAPNYGSYRPDKSDGKPDDVKSNADALSHARQFLNHALREGNRATPHR